MTIVICEISISGLFLAADRVLFLRYETARVQKLYSVDNPHFFSHLRQRRGHSRLAAFEISARLLSLCRNFEFRWGNDNCGHLSMVFYRVMGIQATGLRTAVKKATNIFIRGKDTPVYCGYRDKIPGAASASPDDDYCLGILCSGLLFPETRRYNPDMHITDPVDY